MVLMAAGIQILQGQADIDLLLKALLKLLKLRAFIALYGFCGLETARQELLHMNKAQSQMPDHHTDWIPHQERLLGAA